MILAALEKAKRSRLAPWYTGLGSLLFLVLLFTVPYHVPSRPVVSLSYVFGYNNRAGEFIVAAWLGLLALFGPPLRRGDVAGKPLRRSTLVKALVITGAVSSVLYLATRQLNGIGESVYFNDRLRLVLEGQLPYRDFEYAYGVGLLYVPAALVWVLHLPPGDAYGLCWIGSSLTAVWLMYRTLRAIDVLPGSQRAIFLLFWAYALTALFSQGLNYSLLRFVLPCWCAIVIHRQLVSREGSARRALLLPLPLYALLLIVSPELGVAFAVGISIYLIRFGRLRETARIVAFLATLLGIAAVSWLALRVGAFSTLVAFSAGGYNFPLMPAPHLLLLFLLAALCALYTGEELRSDRSSALLALIAGSACSLAGALGRADQVHALMNPLGVTLSGFLLLSGYVWLRRIVLAVAWFLMFVLQIPTMVYEVPAIIAKSALPAFFAHEYASNRSERMTRADQFILEQMNRQLGPEAAKEKFQERRVFARYLQARTPLDVPRIFGMPPGTIFYAPFGFSPDRFGIYHSPSVEEGYFLGTVNITTPAEANRKTHEITLASARPLLLPPDFEQNCGPSGVGANGYLSNLLRYPYRAPVRHPENLLHSLCEEIHTNFRQIGPSIPENFGYLLWTPDAP